MLSAIDPDPGQALIKIGLAIGVVVMSVVLWTQLLHRSRRFGGGTLAAVIMAAAVVGLLVSIAPNLLSFDIGIFVLIACFFVIYKPDQVVKATGGPSRRYRALHAGRELQVLVRERGGWSVARRNEEVQEKLGALAALEGPETERYLALVRETVVADPDAPGMADRIAERTEAEAELRAALKARPMFERELAKREAALDEGAAAGVGAAE